MYTFPEDLRKAYESQPVPFVYYRYIDQKIVPVLLSDGFCEQMGMDREMATRRLTSGLFETMHPDDAGRIKRITEGFARKECDYDVVFRSRRGDGYHYIHAFGKWQTMPDGTELAVLTYSDVSKSRDEIMKMAEKYMQFQQDHFYTDAVTGLPNLNYLIQFADERVNALRLDGQRPMLLYSDVDSMQFYNTQYGVAQGDELLLLIARELEAAFPGALITRGTDDHFIVIDAYREEADVERRISAVNAQVKTKAYGNTTGNKVGICVYADDMKTTEALDHAKNALKQIGSDLNAACRFYSPNADDEYWSQRYIIENFDQALENGWIKVFYQGIARIQTRKTACFEALARWVDPIQGTISPGEFIPVLEKYHLLYKLDMCMAEQVFKEIPIRVESGLPLLPTSVNFSAQDFDYIDVPAHIDALYEKYGIEKYCGREYFIVEITEQDMATATDRFYEQLKELRRRGFKLWLDDFGSGYSSLNVFSRFDVDLIKFDLDFLRNLDARSGVNRRIMRAMVDIARSMGIHTLAEGLETEAQGAFLQEIGCELAQGFLFRRPEPLESILYRVRSHNFRLNCETTAEREEHMREWFGENRE